MDFPPPTPSTSALAAIAYDELRVLAARHLRGERDDHTFQPTVLVHEAFLRLAEQKGGDWVNRGQFVAVASAMMRRILVDHARRRLAQRHGGGKVLLEISADSTVGEKGRDLEMLALHEALEQLAQKSPRRARVVELRYFGGLELEEIATQLEVTVRTITNDWAFSRAWLHRALRGGSATEKKPPSP